METQNQIQQEKKIPEMTDAEFSVLKRNANLVKSEPEFSGKDLFGLSCECLYPLGNAIQRDEYFDNETPKNKNEDFDRWVSTKQLSNKQLLEKVHAHNKWEREQLSAIRNSKGIMTEEEFYNTNLFKKTL